MSKQVVEGRELVEQGYFIKALRLNVCLLCFMETVVTVHQRCRTHGGTDTLRDKAQLCVMYLGVELNFAYALMTLLTASRKSFSVATYNTTSHLAFTLRRARIANMPASVHTERSSAPVLFGQRRAMSS